MSPLGFGYDEEEDDEQPRAKIARPQPNATPPLALRGVNTEGSTDEMTANADKSRGMNASALSETMQPSPLRTQTASDQGMLAKSQDQGSGISRIGNPWARGALRGIEAIGSVIAPRATARIPGTESHHMAEMAGQRANLAGDVANEEKAATTAETGARTDLATAQADKLRHDQGREDQPKPKEEEWSIVPGMIGPNGQPVQQEKNSGQIRFAPDVQGVGPLKEPQAKTPNDFEQFYADWLKDNNFPDTAHNRLMARSKFAAAGQAPQHDPRQLAVGPDGTVIELKPGSKVAPGTKTVTGDLTNKPSADEQRRADLSENLNENLATLEEIAGRRPDLFGPMAGRLTGIKGALGSNDPDIGTLETIKHQIGMAQISAHGMRSAQGVASAADSILNSFKNGPEAVKASINAARNSVKTFTGDVERAKTGANPQPTPGDGAQPPKAADPGMKWQHRTANGQTEWRQVPQ